MNESIMTSEKARKILAALKRRDRLNRKHRKPYEGPPDWDFAVLNAPKKEREEGKEVRSE